MILFCFFLLGGISIGYMLPRPLWPRIRWQLARLNAKILPFYCRHDWVPSAVHDGHRRCVRCFTLR